MLVAVVISEIVPRGGRQGAGSRQEACHLGPRHDTVGTEAAVAASTGDARRLEPQDVLVELRATDVAERSRGRRAGVSRMTTVRCAGRVPGEGKPVVVAQPSGVGAVQPCLRASRARVRETAEGTGLEPVALLEDAAVAGVRVAQDEVNQVLGPKIRGEVRPAQLQDGVAIVADP